MGFAALTGADALAELTLGGANGATCLGLGDAFCFALGDKSTSKLIRLRNDDRRSEDLSLSVFGETRDGAMLLMVPTTGDWIQWLVANVEDDVEGRSRGRSRRTYSSSRNRHSRAVVVLRD